MTANRSIPFALALVLWLCPASASADHVYSVARLKVGDGERRPTLELQQQVGGWEVALAGYPGDPRTGESVAILVSLQQAESLGGMAYEGYVDCQVYYVSVMGDDERVFDERVVVGPDGALFEHRFEREGNYRVTVLFDDGKKDSSLTFPVVIGSPGAPWVVLLGFLGSCVLFVGTIRYLKSRRNRTSISLAC